MKRAVAIAAGIILVLFAGFFLAERGPSVRADDFENEVRVLQDERLPPRELDLRREEIAPFVPPREGEPPKEAALDSLHEYTRAGLYEEALGVLEQMQSQYELGALYYEYEGDLMARMRQYRDAAGAYRRSLNITKTADVYKKVGELYLTYSERPERAVVFYEEALERTEKEEERRALQIRVASLKSRF